MKPDRFEVQRLVAAPPEVVFALLCEPTGHVSIDSSGMLQSAEGERVTGPDDTFVVHMDRESLGDHPIGKYDVEVIVTRFEKDRLIEWTISRGDGPAANHKYGYRLEPDPAGTLTTSYYDWSEIPEQYRALNIFPTIPESGLRATLGILARTVESTA